MGKTWNVGDVLGAADMNEWAGGSTGLLVASKPADTSRTSNVALTNDPDLSVTAGANKTYEMWLNVSYISPTAAGLKYTMVVPSGTVFTGGGFVVNNSGGIGQVVAYDSGAGELGLTSHLTSTTSIVYNLQVQGTLYTAGTGGAVTFQWAQDASNASATLVKQGSSLRLRRVA